MNRKNTITSLFIGAFAILIFSCKKDDDGGNQGPVLKSLELTITNELLSPLAQAEVKLFNTEVDYTTLNNQIGSTVISNDQGVVKFENLPGTKYYWRVNQGCRNNANGVYTNATPLSASGVNQMNVSCLPTGRISITNNTEFSGFDVYVNGSFDFNFSETQFNTVFLNNRIIGTYTVDAPSLGQSTTDEVICGGTMVVVFD